MTRSELKEALDQRGADPRSYSLDGGSHMDEYCIEQSAGGWAVYYSERYTERIDERWFKYEEEACAELLRRLVSDPTTRIRRGPPSEKSR